jgi:hypothetical protein
MPRSVIPPGHEFAWYNIRSCISDEGYFYVPRLFNSHQQEGLHTPGTLEILCVWPMSELEATHSGQIIAYFMLVNVMIQITQLPRE